MLSIPATMLTMSKPTDLIQGTLDCFVLKILASEPLHGRAIGERIKDVSTRRGGWSTDGRSE